MPHHFGRQSLACDLMLVQVLSHVLSDDETIMKTSYSFCCICTALTTKTSELEAAKLRIIANHVHMQWL